MKLLITPISLLLFIAAGAQSFYTKAVIYKSDGSRMDCFIKNTTYEGTQQAFEYTLEKGGALKTIHVSELNKVEFEDGMILEKYFISIISMSLPITGRREFNYEAPENKLAGWFMIEKLISSSYSLYQYIDKYEFRHFFYKKADDSTIQKMEFKVYTTDDGDTIINKREFRNDLLFLAAKAGCSEKLNNEISRTEYKFSQLVSIFKKLNTCEGVKTELNSGLYSGKGAVRFSVAGGLSATQLTMATLNQGTYPGFAPDLFSGSISPLLGFSLEFIPRKRQKNYIASVDFLYSPYQAETDSIHPNSYTTTIGFIKYSTLNLSPSVRVRLTKNNVAPFIEAGFSLRFVLSKEDYYLIRTNVDVKKPIFGNKGSSSAYFGGAGVDLKRVSVHVRYSLAITKTSTYYNTIFLMGKFNLSKKSE